MALEQKRISASKLLRLTGSANLPGSRDAPDSLAQAMKRLNEMQFEAMTDLYVKYFSEEQLNYQLDFYQSEIGQSILETRRAINAELPHMLASLTEQLNLENSNLQEHEKGDFSIQSSSSIPEANEPPDDSDA